MTARERVPVRAAGTAATRWGILRGQKRRNDAPRLARGMRHERTLRDEQRHDSGNWVTTGTNGPERALIHSPLVEKVWESIVSGGASIGLFIVAAVVFALLPERWKTWLRRWRGVLAAGFFLVLATVAISVGVAILVTDDHFGAATPKDAYVVGPFFIVLGFAVLGFAVAAYRHNPVR